MAVNEQLILEVDELEAEKMGKRKDMSYFDKGVIVMARRVVQCISKMSGLMVCYYGKKAGR